MSEIPKAPIARIIKDTGAERVSEDAKAELAEYREEVARDVAIEANNVAILFTSDSPRNVFTHAVYEAS